MYFSNNVQRLVCTQDDRTLGMTLDPHVDFGDIKSETGVLKMEDWNIEDREWRTKNGLLHQQ